MLGVNPWPCVVLTTGSFTLCLAALMVYRQALHVWGQSPRQAGAVAGLLLGSGLLILSLVLMGPPGMLVAILGLDIQRGLKDAVRLHVVLGISMLIWSGICLWLYRCWRQAQWLAGSTGASCLFGLGLSLAAGMYVVQAWFLLPLWGSVLGFTLHHVLAASRETQRLQLAPPKAECQPPWALPFDYDDPSTLI